MGSFWKLHYVGGRWQPAAGPEPFLIVDVHDSDIATIDYRPSGSVAVGRFYLGFQPRYYFDDLAASDPVDLDAEAAGFARWTQEHVGTVVNVPDVRSLLAQSDGDEPSDTYVEETVVRLLSLAGIPAPTGDEIAAGDTLR